MVSPVPEGKSAQAQISLLQKIIFGLLLVYGLLFAYTSLTRTRQLSADSLNYIDVGRNLARGQGLFQSTLVIARPQVYWDAVRTISPFVSQPPLYPVAIAAAGWLAGSFSNAALLVSVFSLMAAVLIGYLLSRELFDSTTAWLTAAVLALAPYLAYVSRWAWSEALSIVLILLNLWLLSKIIKTSTKRLAITFALGAGLAAGLAFSTRYALIVLVLPGLLFLYIENLPKRKTKLPGEGDQESQTGRLSRLLPQRIFWSESIVFVAGWAIPVALVSLHNFLVIGRPLPVALPAEKGVAANLIDAAQALFGSYLSVIVPPGPQYLLLGLLILGIVAAAIYRGNPLGYFRERLLERGRYLFWVWPLIYTGFVVYQRSTSFFDELDIRLLAPAGVVLSIGFVGLLSGLFLPKKKPDSYSPGDHLSISSRGQLILLALTCLFSGIGVIQQIHLLFEPPASSMAQDIAGSPRLSWIAANTTADDLIIGDTTNDIAYFFDRQAAVSFSPYPYTILLTPSTVQDLADHYCGRYDHLYLILRKRYGTAIKNRQFFGRYVSNLLDRDPASYPELALVIDLPDSQVYRITLCGDG